MLRVSEVILGKVPFLLRNAISALLLPVILAATTLQAQTYTVIHNFTGGQDGGTPMAGLTMDPAGSLLGTAVLVAPVVVAVVLTQHVSGVVRMPLLLVCAACYGLALAVLGVRLAARLAEDRLPELVEIAVRSRL